MTYLLSNVNIKANDRVQASANSSATLCQLHEAWQSVLNALHGILDLLHSGAGGVSTVVPLATLLVLPPKYLGIATKLLAEGQGGSILGVRASNLDNVFELVRLGKQRSMQLLQARDGDSGQLHGSGNVHASGEGVVGGLQRMAYQEQAGVSH